MSGEPGNADVPVGSSAKENANDDVGVPGVGALGVHTRKEWYSRGYLPHRDAAHLIQSITYRLGDSLPQAKLAQLQQELESFPKNERELHSRKQIEEWLDAGMGCCALRHPEVARYVQDSFLHFHAERYDLYAWCIMPNHVHILVEPLTDLATIIQGWKSFTARWILKQNKRLGLNIPQNDRFWMREYWDRYIRNREHYRNTVDYIHNNPVKAGLCQSPANWTWSSAHPENADEDTPIRRPREC